MAADSIRLVRGQCAEHRTQAESGNTAKREFCAVCGTPLFASSVARTQFVGVKASSLDDPSWFAPEANVWVASSQPWDHLDPNVPSFPKNRPRPANA